MNHIPPVKAVSNDEEHRQVADVLSVFMQSHLDCGEGSAEAAYIRAQAVVLSDYEDRRWPIPKEWGEEWDPVDYIKEVAADRHIPQRELASCFGSQPNCSAVLNRRRGLTLPMIRKLHAKLGIPAEILIRAPRAPVRTGRRGSVGATGDDVSAEIRRPRRSEEDDEIGGACHHEGPHEDAAAAEPVGGDAGGDRGRRDGQADRARAGAEHEGAEPEIRRRVHKSRRGEGGAGGLDGPDPAQQEDGQRARDGDGGARRARRPAGGVRVRTADGLSSSRAAGRRAGPAGAGRILRVRPASREPRCSRR